jgi:hypothetical protein
MDALTLEQILLRVSSVLPCYSSLHHCHVLICQSPLRFETALIRQRIIILTKHVVSSTNTKCLMLFRERTDVHMKVIYSSGKMQSLNVKACGTYVCHCALWD